MNFDHKNFKKKATTKNKKTKGYVFALFVSNESKGYFICNIN